MTTASQITWTCLGLVALVAGSYLVHAAITKPPDPTPPCVETLYKNVGSDGQTCPVGATAEKLDDHVIVCRCPRPQAEQEGAAP